MVVSFLEDAVQNMDLSPHRRQSSVAHSISPKRPGTVSLEGFVLQLICRVKLQAANTEGTGTQMAFDVDNELHVVLVHILVHG